MKLRNGQYAGTGINHDKEEFEGKLTVLGLPGTTTKSLHYIATRLSDDVKVHEELGYLAKNENGEEILHVHMEELPCVTIHTVKDASEDRYVFAYKGIGLIEGFSSELVFEFDEEKVTYLHRWAMSGAVSDKSWCLLEPIGDES